MRDGQRARFGALHLDGDGVHAAASSVRWADLTRIVRVGNVVELYAHEARFQPVLYVPEPDVPDVEGFVRIAAEAYEARAEGRLRVESVGADEAPPVHDTKTAVAAAVEHGTLIPPPAPPGTVDEMLARGAEKGLSGTPRWYTAHRNAAAVPEDGVLALFGHGFAVASRGDIAAYHWDEVSRTVAKPTIAPAGGKDVFVFGAPDDRPLVTNGRFRDVGLHSGRLSQTHGRYLLDRAVAAFADGGEASFGAVTVTRDGFGYGGQVVPWSAVSGVRAESTDAQGPDDTLLVDLADESTPIPIRAGEVANRGAFATLVQLMTAGPS